jgi:multiple sugar transport system substrate-binding protein
MSTRISRREFVGLWSTAVAGSVLAACAPQPAPKAAATTAAVEQRTGAPQETKLQGKIAWYAAQDPDHVPAFRKQEEMWKEMHPEVEIEEVWVPWDEYYTKMTTMVAGGEAIDVVWLQMSNVPGTSLNVGYWVTRDALMDFTPFFESGRINPDDYFAGLLKEWLFQDKYWGTPFEVFQESFWYNADLFEEAGLEVPNADWKWEDYRQAAEALTSRSADGRVEQFGTMEPRWLDFVYEAGAQPVAPDGETLQLDTPEAKRGLEEWYYYTGNGFAPLGDDTKTFAGLHTGKVAMHPSGNYMWNTFRQASKDLGFGLGATVMPAGPGPAPKNKAGFIGYNVWSVFKNTKYPEAAAEYAIFLGYGQGAEPWAATGRVSPVKRFDLDYYQKVANLDGAEKEQYAMNLNTTFTNMEKGYVHPEMPYLVVGDVSWGTIADIFTDELNKVVIEKSQSLDQAIEVANGRAATALEEAKSS